MASLPAGVQEVSRVAAPGGGFYVLGSDGGVFAIDGANYYGSVTGLQGDSLAGQHQFDGNSLTLDPTGGYKVTDTAGRSYDFNTQYAQSQGYNVPQATNPLYQNPAFQAFIRSSGLGLDIASADVDRQVAAKNRAYNARVADMTDPNYGSIAQGKENLNNSFESRGVLRSGARDVAANKYDVTQSRTLADLSSGHAADIAQLQAQIPQKIGAIAAQGSEMGLDVGADQEYQTGLAALQKKYPAAYGTGS